MNPTITKKDRFLGCFLGGAVGDALGYPVEFVDEGYIQKKYGPQGIQTLAQAGEGCGPAVITDDTQMTLFVINGLLYGMTGRTNPDGTINTDSRYDDAAAVWLAHQEWLGTQGDTSRMADPAHPKMWIYHEPALHALRAPGGTCLSSIRDSEHGGTPREPVNNSKGCGAVMKAAPFGLVNTYDAKKHCGSNQYDVYKYAVHLGAQTHGHPLGYLSASSLALILAKMAGHNSNAEDTLHGAILGAWYASELDLPIGHEITIVYDGILRAICLALDTSVSDLDAIHQLGEGWVAEEALFIAIFCAVRYQNDFAKAIRTAVNHRGDSDSTGSICGNILGAWLGKDAVAAAFDLENLEMRELIEEMASDFYQAVKYGVPVGDAQWDAKYRQGKKLTPEELARLAAQEPTSDTETTKSTAQNSSTQIASTQTVIAQTGNAQAALAPLRPVGLRYTAQTKLALRICCDAHLGQTDKSGLPYILHPFHLAEQMETEEEICTALLHDVLEDTRYTEDDLRRAGISETVLAALRLLTHDPGTPYMDYVSALRVNPLARKVKQADLLHNSDIGRLDHPTEYDLGQQKKYRMAMEILA